MYPWGSKILAILLDITLDSSQICSVDDVISLLFHNLRQNILSKRIYFWEIQVNNFAKGHFHRFTSTFKDNYLANIEKQGKYIPITSFDDVTWLRDVIY